MSVLYETDLGDAVLVDEQRLVDVTKLHAPDLEILVSAASRKKLSI
jgi:hypothetical protein